MTQSLRESICRKLEILDSRTDCLDRRLKTTQELVRVSPSTGSPKGSSVNE
jgi:hypothetical protein